MEDVRVVAIEGFPSFVCIHLNLTVFKDVTYKQVWNYLSKTKPQAVMFTSLLDEFKAGHIRGLLNACNCFGVEHVMVTGTFTTAYVYEAPNTLTIGRQLKTLCLHDTDVTCKHIKRKPDLQIKGNMTGLDRLAVFVPGAKVSVHMRWSEAEGGYLVNPDMHVRMETNDTRFVYVDE